MLELIRGSIGGGGDRPKVVSFKRLLSVVSSFDVQLLELESEVNLDCCGMLIRLTAHAWSYRHRYR